MFEVFFEFAFVLVNKAACQAFHVSWSYASHAQLIRTSSYKRNLSHAAVQQEPNNHCNTDQEGEAGHFLTGTEYYWDRSDEDDTASFNSGIATALQYATGNAQQEPDHNERNTGQDQEFGVHPIVYCSRYLLNT